MAVFHNFYTDLIIQFASHAILFAYYADIRLDVSTYLLCQSYAGIINRGVFNTCFITASLYLGFTWTYYSVIVDKHTTKLSTCTVVY